jgi:hypothetical protein
MRLQAARPAVVPLALKSELLAVPAGPVDCPGLIVAAPGQGSPAWLVDRKHTASLFDFHQELALLKSVTALVAQQVDPRLKMGVDAVWLVYSAAQLQDEWNRPDADRVGCAFKLGALAMGTVSLVGGLDAHYQLPDRWANGFNYLLKSGEMLYQGRTPGLSDLLLNADKRMDIPLKVLKLAGVSIDANVPPKAPAGLTWQRVGPAPP